MCIRLYDEADYRNRPPFTDPELLRSGLAGVILRMKSLGLGEVEEFPFIDPPSSRPVDPTATSCWPNCTRWTSAAS